MAGDRIELDSRAEEVHRLLEWLEPRLAATGLDEMSAFHLRCAVVEAVNNSIQHAYQDEPGHPVVIDLRLTAGHAVVEVLDQGPAFEGPSATTLADPLAESGRGYAIIQAWVDRLEITREDGWNICRLVRNFSEAG